MSSEPGEASLGAAQDDNGSFLSWLSLKELEERSPYPTPTPLPQLPQHPLRHRIIQPFIRALLLDGFLEERSNVKKKVERLGSK